MHVKRNPTFHIDFKILPTERFEQQLFARIGSGLVGLTYGRAEVLTFQTKFQYIQKPELNEALIG